MGALADGLMLFQVQVWDLANKDVGNDTFNPGISIPQGNNQEGSDAIGTILSWGQGIVVIIGIIGVLFCAGKMAVGKFGRSDLAAEGVGGLVWTVLGISLMLIAVPLIMLLIGNAGGGAPAEGDPDDEVDGQFTTGEYGEISLDRPVVI